MALTRPTIQNINTNLTTFTDSLTVTNFGNVANRDIGEIFDRSQGGGSNVAIVWNEANQSFRMGYTSSTGKETGNITFTGNADLIVGNLKAGNLIVANVIYENTEYVSSTEVVAGNSTVNALTVNNSATIGTTLGVTGNIYATNIIPTANATYNLGSPTQRFKSLYLSGNTVYMDGATISSNSTAIVFTNPTGGSFTIDGSDAIVANSTSQLALYVTGSAQGNITSVGTLTGLTLSGSLEGTAIYADTFGNNGAKFVGTVFTGGTFNGPLNGTLGSAGGNTAIVSTLTGTGNATVNALTVNTSATVGTTLGVVGNLTAGNINTAGTASINQLVIASGIQNTPIGNATPSTGNFTTLNTTGAISGATTIVTTGAATHSSIISNSTLSVGTTASIAGTATVNALVSNGAIQGTAITGSGTGTFASVVSNGAIQGTTIGGSGTATVNALTVNNSATVGTTLSATGGIQNTPIGNATASSGNFTTLNATGAITGATTITTTGAATVNAITSNTSITGASLNVTGNATIGNLDVLGTVTYINSTTLDVQDPIIELNTGANGTPLSGSAPFDAGIKTHYWDGLTDRQSFFGRTNDTGNFEYYSNVISETGNVVTGTYGTIKTGNIQLTGLASIGTTLAVGSNATVNALTVNGAATVGSTLGVTGNIVAGNISITDINATNGIFINNVTIAGTLTTTSNIVANTSGIFFGNTSTGFNAIYAGIPVGYSSVPNEIAQFSGNANAYVQINAQNINSGNQATTDWIATSPSGTDTTYYIDMGVTGLNYDNTNANNSLGTSLVGGDAYLYAQGNTSATQGGNLVVGATTVGKQINFIAGGVNAANVAATLSSTAFTVKPTTASTNSTNGAIVTLGGLGVAGAINAGGAITSTGNATVAALTVNGSATVGTTLGVSGNIIAGNVSAGTVNATYFIGNGSQLTGLPAQYANANVAAYLPTYSGTIGGQLLTNAQPNITSVGTLTTLAVSGTISSSGNVTSGNLTVNGSATIGTTLGVTGNVVVGNLTTGSGTGGIITGANIISANYFIGNGSGLTSITGANVTGTVANATYATNAGSSNFATTAGTATYVTNATQANITSLGNLTALTVAGDTIMYGNLQVLGNTTYFNSNVVTTNDLNITVGNNQTTGTALNGAGIDVGSNSLVTWRYNNATTSWQSNVGITPTANASLNLGGTSNYWNNVYAVQYNGSAAGLTNIPGAQVTGTVANATYATNAGSANFATTATGATYVTGLTSANVTTALSYVPLDSNSGAVSAVSASTAQYVTANAQANITSVGTLTGLDVSGTITTTGITSSGNATVSALTVNGSATIGSTLGVTGNIYTGNVYTNGLFWPNGTAISTGGGGSITFTSALNPPVSGNIKGDQWYNTATDVIYEYAYDGVNYYWVDISGAAFGNSSGTGDQLSPFLLMGA